jgi:UDP-N-acetylglucosamine 1-carboxyvinyltransferase
MSKLKIIGGKKLSGDISVSGAKNSALKIIPASILANSEVKLNNVPNITDIFRMEEILKSLGADIQVSGNTVIINSARTNSYKPDVLLVKKLRGSIVAVGPLLARCGKAVFGQPGGCLIGARPIDDHLDAFRQMGVKISQKGEEYRLVGYPKPAEVILSKMSVTATENAIMASVFVKGKTIIRMAAAEPEVADLANFLNKMGAEITGAGTHEIEVRGVSNLNGIEYNIMPDRVEAATYLIAAIGTNSNLTIGPIIPEHLSIVMKKLEFAGANFDIITKNDQKYFVTAHHGKLRSQDIDTRTYPGFPTDLQSPFAVLMTQASGTSRIFETLFEGRFLYLSELTKMGAKVKILSSHIIQVDGPEKLKGQSIICQDIRGGAALVIAALIADGETIIDQAEFIDRGYENLDQKLKNVGADIERID